MQSWDVVELGRLLRRLRNKFPSPVQNICYGVCSQIFHTAQISTLRRIVDHYWVAENASRSDSEYAVASWWRQSGNGWWSGRSIRVAQKV